MDLFSRSLHVNDMRLPTAEDPIRMPDDGPSLDGHARVALFVNDLCDAMGFVAPKFALRGLKLPNKSAVLAPRAPSARNCTSSSSGGASLSSMRAMPRTWATTRAPS